MTGRDNNTDDKIRLLGGIGAWSKMQNPQYEEHQKIIHKFYPRAKFPQSPEQDEEHEDKLIRFFVQTGLSNLFQDLLGLGKSRYALKSIS